MSTEQTYEDLEAKYEIEENNESIILRVHIPAGFTREHIGAKVEHAAGKVNVYGERSLENNKRARFNTLYQIPEYCDISKIKGKFDGKTVTITIPIIPEKVPKQKPQEEPQETDPNPPEEEQEGDTPPQSEAADDDQAETGAKDDVSEPTADTKEEDDHETETSKPPKDTQEEESMDQKGQEGIPPNATITKVDSEKVKQVGEETETKTSTPLKETQQESKPQEDQEGIPTKDTITKVESKKQVGEETVTSTPTKDMQKESMPQKGHEQETIPQKDTFTTNAKLQGEEKFEGEIDENEEKQKVIGKEGTEENSNKESLESGKAHEEKDVVDDSLEKESKEERKGLDTFEGDTGMEVSGKIGNNDDVEKESDIKAMNESTTRTRIKEVAASASQAMTSLAKGFKNEEDKQRIIYMGAAVIVVALGVYATYKFRSRRP